MSRMDRNTTYNHSQKFGSCWIEIPEPLIDVQFCVFKLYYNEKYVVLMGKSLFRQVEIIRDNLAYYFGRRKGSLQSSKKPDDFCEKFYEYVYDHPGGTFRIELVICGVSRSPYILLQQNQIELDRRDLNCLNTNDVPELSKYIQMPALYRTGRYKDYKHWINSKWQWNRQSKRPEYWRTG